jgi:DNA-binding protein
MSSLEKYRLVSNTKADFDNIHVPSVCRGWTKKVCELKISQKGKPKHYIADALHMFHQGSQTIIIRAMGRAMSKAITIAEVLKRKLTVYQVTHLSTINVVDVSETAS